MYANGGNMKNCNSKIQKILALLLSVMFIFVSCSDIFSGREETGSVTFNTNILFKDETKIEIALTIPGGNGIDGLLFDKNNAITGFNWSIDAVTLKAAQ